MDNNKLEKTVEKLQKVVEDHEKQLEFQKDYIEKIKNSIYDSMERTGKDDKRDAIQYTNTKIKDVCTVLKSLETRIKKLEDEAFAEPRPR